MDFVKWIIFGGKVEKKVEMWKKGGKKIWQRDLMRRNPLFSTTTQYNETRGTFPIPQRLELPMLK